LRLKTRVPFDRLQSPRPGRRIELARSQQVCPSKNGVQRCAQLVGDGAKELVLHSAGGLPFSPGLLGAVSLFFGGASGAAQLGNDSGENEALENEQHKTGVRSGVVRY
jgi:hypothetical protein